MINLLTLIINKLKKLNTYTDILYNRFVFRVVDFNPTITFESGFSQQSNTTNYFYLYGQFLYNNINATKSTNFSTGAQSTKVVTVVFDPDIYADRYIASTYVGRGTSAPNGGLKAVYVTGSGSSTGYNTRIFYVLAVDTADKGVSFRFIHSMLYKSLFS